MNGPLRIIFPATVLFMWVLVAFGVATDQWNSAHWEMAALALLCCAVVFVNFVYVFSYGYGLSMIVVSLWLALAHPSAAALLVAALCIAFGLRLCWFVYARYQTPGYAGSRTRAAAAHAAMPWPVKIYLWFAVGTLMTFEAMPLSRVADRGTLDAWVIGGAMMMAIGLVLEAVADWQKQAFKAHNPEGFARHGLYRWVRQPNYLGEVIVQAGLLLTALGSASGWYAITTALVAPCYIVVLMYYAALDTDRRRAERLSADLGYREYLRKTGLLLPGF